MHIHVFARIRKVISRDYKQEIGNNSSFYKRGMRDQVNGCQRWEITCHDVLFYV